MARQSRPYLGSWRTLCIACPLPDQSAYDLVRDEHIKIDMYAARNYSILSQLAIALTASRQTGYVADALSESFPLKLVPENLS